MPFMNLNYLWAGTSSSNSEILVVGVINVCFFGSAGYYGLGGSKRAEIKDPNGLSLELREW